MSHASAQGASKCHESDWVTRAWLTLMLALHLGLGAWSASLSTPTADEFAHVPAGLAYWSHAAWPLYSKNPPAVKLYLTLPLIAGLAGSLHIPEVNVPAFGWGPWQYGSEFERANEPVYLQAFFWARLMNLLLSASTGFLVFAWARRLTSEVMAAVAASGFLLSTTVLAHASLATVDIGASLAIFAFCFLLTRLGDHPTLYRLAGVGATLGLALTSKFTALFVLPWFVLWLILEPNRTRKRKLLWIAGTTFLVLNMSYGFSSPWRTLDSFHFTSRLMNSATGWLPASTPIPVPCDFVAGFDAQVGDAEQGEFSNYLLGEWSRDGWWYYNLAALGLKENPLTLLLFFTVPFAFWGVRRDKWFPLAIPLIALALPLLFFNPLQVGVRYLLPLFPFVFVLIAFVLQKLTDKFGARAGFSMAAVALLAWLFTALTAAPDFVSAFSPLVKGDKARYLLDSNLDWGQDLYRVRKISAQYKGEIGLVYFGHVPPSLYGIHYHLPLNPTSRGVAVVSANYLRGMSYVVTAPDGTWVQLPPDTMVWLKTQKPKAIEGSLYIYDLDHPLPADAP